MRPETLQSIDEYEAYLTNTIHPWSPEQRVALAAGLAERWLPAYEAFSQAEDWGDSAALRRILEAIWGHARGRRLARADVQRYRQQLHDSTPHMDDFDAFEALMACSILGDALRCCHERDNIAFALQAALSCFDAEEPDWPLAPADQQRVWQQIAIRRELQDQLALVEQIAAAARLDDDAVQALRRGLKLPRFLKTDRPRPAEPPGITNQTAFEQYRRMVEADIKGKYHTPLDFDGGAYMFALSLFGEWFGRYSRRLQTINGSYGRLADEAGQRALVAWNRARDAAVPGLPDWDAEVRATLELCLTNNQVLGDVDAGLEKPHGYGPSLRRLWLEARRRGLGEREAWLSLRDWADHRPAAWAAEDQRKKKGLAHAAPALGPALAREVRWAATGDPAEPWAAEVDGEAWRVRLNDFPDDLLYSLVRGGAVVGGFHDWPETWQRP